MKAGRQAGRQAGRYLEAVARESVLGTRRRGGGAWRRGETIEERRERGRKPKGRREKGVKLNGLVDSQTRDF